MGDDKPTVPTKDDRMIKLGEAMGRIEVDAETGLAVAKSMMDQVAVAAWALESGLLPTSIETKAQAWMVMQRGAELGFPGLTAFEFLYPVNGRVRLTPDGAKAKALASGLLEDFHEEVTGSAEQLLARVTVKRKGIPTPIVGEFSMYDARLAGLHQKDNWKKYPQRMCKARARGFAFGDAFRDIVGGLQVRETYDLDPGESITPAREPGRKAALPPPPMPDPLLDELSGAPADAPPFASHAEADAELAKTEG